MQNARELSVLSSFNIPSIPITQSNYHSQSTILSNQQSSMIKINEPLYAEYSSSKQDCNQSQQKVLIRKRDLVEFSQRFAQEKISLERVVEQMRKQNDLLKRQISAIQNKNEFSKNYNMTKRIKQSSMKQTQMGLGEVNESQKIKQQYQQQCKSLEVSLQFSKSILSETQKKLQFIQQKLAYQQSQITRYQQLLKIKQAIIQNFEWQKSARSSNNQNCANNQRKYVCSGDVLKQNILTRNTDQNKVQETKQLPKDKTNDKSLVIQNNRPKKYEIGKMQNKNREQCQGNNGIVKKDSKTKLNISIGRNSSSKEKEQDLSNNRINKSSGKLKSITLKRPNNPANNLINNSSQYNSHLLNQSYLSQTINQLKNKLDMVQQQNAQLKHQLQTQSKIREPQNSKANEQMIQMRKYTAMRQKCIMLEGQIQKTIRKYLILKQRNNQLENQMEELRNAWSKNSNNRLYHQQSSNNRNKANQFSINNSALECSSILNPSHNISLQSTQPLQKPSLTLSDLVTPQFRQQNHLQNSNNRFFPKSLQQKQEFQFSKISIENNRQTKILETFDRRQVVQRKQSQKNQQIKEDQICEDQEQIQMAKGFKII